MHHLSEVATLHLAKTRVKTLREIGAKEVHMVVSCPPHAFPCHYGIDFSTKGELIAASKSVDEIRDFVGLDSLGYLPIDEPQKSDRHSRSGSLLRLF